MNCEDFIKENYSKLGLKKCSEILSLSKGKVTYIVKKFNLKMEIEDKKQMFINIRRKKSEEYNVSINNFTTNITKESVYILGLLWADGYINKTNRNCDINLECVDYDMDYFKTILNRLGKWNYYTRQRDNYQPITKATTSNRELLEFLSQNNYDNKSFNSPCLIIEKIPNNLLKYFLLGIVDGDGCFYFNKKHSLRQFSISGSLNQDWTAFEKIFNNLNINYKINRKPNSKNGSSEIRVLNRTNIKKLGDYLYDTINIDNIGLKRKYFKYLEIIHQ
jgi:hypothetical protein